MKMYEEKAKVVDKAKRTRDFAAKEVKKATINAVIASSVLKKKVDAP
ncbi:hypothetical protein CASFOL_002229 [Castilleja foliolosa]|uniref:Uncharacterized protein n=1 Tax=Castilleja foliolosa TaxID=1961234 RepID=A0ABD3EDZ0_9LAMI